MARYQTINTQEFQIQIGGKVIQGFGVEDYIQFEMIEDDVDMSETTDGNVLFMKKYSKRKEQVTLTLSGVSGNLDAIRPVVNLLNERIAANTVSYSLFNVAYQGTGFYFAKAVLMAGGSGGAIKKVGVEDSSFKFTCWDIVRVDMNIPDLVEMRY